MTCGFRADPDATDTYNSSQLEIFTINKDGSNLVQITNNERLDASPKWSKDGTSIYFISHGNQEKPKIYKKRIRYSVEEKGDINTSSYFNYPRSIHSLDILEQNARGLGNLGYVPEKDGVVRKHQ